MADLERPPSKRDLKTEASPLLVGQHIEKHTESHHSRRFVIICILLFGLVAGGVYCVKVIEGWQVITSLYVIVQIVTTVGYGDFVVTNDLTKLFCAFYVLLLWVFGAYAFNHAFSWVQTRSVALTRRKLKVLSAKRQTPTETIVTTTTTETVEVETVPKSANDDLQPDTADFLASTLLAILAIAFGTVFYATVESCTCSYGVSYRSGCKDDTYEECIETGGYKKNWITSFYMSVITLTTVGFGDHSPRSLVGRCIGSLWMLVGVAFMAKWFSNLAKLFFDIEQKQRLKVTHELSEELFKQIDKDKSGSLSRAEFTNYFLVHNGLISQRDLDEIDSHFDSLDYNKSNSVTWDDIKHHMLD